MNKNLQKLRQLPGAKLRRCLSPGDSFRWLAAELEAAPDEIHVIDLGDGEPLEVIPRDDPGFVADLRRYARMLDGQADN